MKVISPLTLASMMMIVVGGLSLAQSPATTPAPPAPANLTPPAAPGTPTPPASTPESTPPNTPTPGATPSPTPPADDEGAQIHKMLGDLSPYLIAAISMDNEANGSLIMARAPAGNQAIFSLKKRFGIDQGRQCADFSEPGTALSVYGIPLGNFWTLAMWVKLPFAGDEAILWRGLNYNFLCLLDGKFKSLRGGEDHTFGDYDKSWTGWHHIALTSDGTTHTLYIDAMPIGTAPTMEKPTLNYIGGQSMMAVSRPATSTTSTGAGAVTPAPVKSPSNFQCSLLDDMFIIEKAMAPEEIQKLALVRLPAHELQSPPPPVAPTQVPNGPNSISPEGTALAAELVKTLSNSLVFVSGTDGSGSGFIAEMGGKPFMITNAHVSAGVRGVAFRTLKGTTIPVAPASVAVAHDIFVMSSKPVEAPVAVMRDVSSNAAIGDEIVVLGNAEGGGVINAITGRIVGIGPDRIEVDAPFQPGNSGSPIIHLKSKKAIGVATYLTIRKYDTATKEAIDEPVIRRFGYRIDSVKTWQPVDWNVFYAQAAELDAIEKTTYDLVALIKDIVDDSRVEKYKHSNPAIRNRIDSWLASKSKRMSSKDAIAQDQNFLSFLKVTCQTDITHARQRLTYDYFQRQIGDHHRERSEIAGVFARIIDTVR